MVTFNSLGKYGRLGNQMFQVASTIGIAKANGFQYSFNDWYCKYTLENKQQYFETKLPHLINKPKNYEEQQFTYKPIKLSEPVNLHGYFQSEKYFKHCEHDVRGIFKPSQSVLNIINSKYSQTLKGNTCAIHVRRGDYVASPILDLCQQDYYAKSIKHMRSIGVTKFIVFSDDIPYCKQIFDKSFIFIEGNKDGVDLHLMSMCKHQIIANSTFSWWGAWLNTNPNKVVIAPKNWFKEGNAKDIYTENMIVL